MTRWYHAPVAIVFIAIMSLALFVPGISSLPPVDRDESRFAQASRQMFESAALPPTQRDTRVNDAGVPVGLHSGSWAVPMFGETPRLNKPPLIYWLQAGSAWIFTGGDPSRDAIWMYRVPSVVCGTLSVVVTLLLGVSMRSHVRGVAAAVLLVCSPMMIWDAHQARSDQLLTLTTLLTMCALWAIWSRRDDPARGLGGFARAGAFWLAMGLGILSKGPITPLIAVLAIVTLCVVGGVRSRVTGRVWLWRLKPLMGLVILGVVLSPWLIAIDQAIGLRKYASIVYDEFVVRGTSGSREGHFAPPGFHLVLSAVLLFPASMFLVDAVRRAWRRWAVAPTTTRSGVGRWRRLLPKQRNDRQLFLLAWLVPAWIVFELSPAKLPHYVMPLYPAACLLCAQAMLALERRVTIRAFADPQGASGRLRRLNTGDFIAIGVHALVPVAAIVASIAWMIRNAPSSSADMVPLIGGGAVALIGTYFVARGVASLRRSSYYAFVMSVYVSLFMSAVLGISAALPAFVPGAKTARLFAPLSPIINAESSPTAERPPIASVYHEDSVVFWSRGRVVRIHTLNMPQWLREHPDGVAIIDERQLAEATALGFTSIYNERGENSTMPKGQRATVLHVVTGPRASPRPEPAQ